MLHCKVCGSEHDDGTETITHIVCSPACERDYWLERDWRLFCPECGESVCRCDGPIILSDVAVS